MDRAARAFKRYLSSPTRRRLEKVVSHYHGLVWRTAFRVAQRREDADDICQDVFLKLLLDPPRPESVKSPQAYLVWAAIGRATNLRRAAERRRTREAETIVRAHEDSVAAGDVEALDRAIASLGEDLASTLRLRYFGGMANGEIAAALGIAERTVEERLRRGREILRRRLSRASLGLAALLSALEADAAPLPVDLLVRLQRITRMGSALAATRAAAAAGGTFVAKKLTLCSVALVLFSIPAARFVWNDAGVPGEEPLELTEGSRETSTLDLAAAPAPPERSPAAADTEPPQPRPARLRGIVRDQDEALIEGAIVRIHVEPPGEIEKVLETASDAAGEFAFVSVSPGYATITAEQEGYLMMAAHFAVSLDEGEEDTVAIYLCRPYRLAGSIVDAAGTPIPGAALWLDEAVAEHETEAPADAWPAIEGYRYWRRFPTDRRGDYDTGPRLIITRFVGRGSFVPARAAADGYATLEKVLRHADLPERDIRLDFVLEPEMPISLIAVDSAGRPLEGAKVGRGSIQHWHGDRERYSVAVTDARGRAVLARHPQARHELRVEKDGYRPAELVVEPGASTEMIVTLTEQGPGIHCRLSSDPGCPELDEALKSVDLYLERFDQDGKRVSLIRGGGKQDVAAGEFVFWPEPGRYSLRAEVGLLSKGTEAFEYTGLGPVRADIHFAFEPPYVAGTVVSRETGEPMAGVSVSVRFVAKETDPRSSWSWNTTLNGFYFPDRPGIERSTTTGDDGEFLLLLPRDNGRQQFWSPRSSVAVIGAGSEERGWSEDIVLEFDRGTVVADLQLEIAPAGSIAGRVTTADGQGAIDALVVASDFQGTTAWATSDRDGRYLIGPLRAGRYLVVPIARGEPQIGSSLAGDDSIPGLPPPHELFTRPVAVTSGETTRWDIDLRTDGLCRIEGRVADDLLPAAARVESALVWRGQEAAAGATALRGEWKVRDGAFTAEVLQPGTYRLRVRESGSGGVLAEEDVDVGRGQVARLLLEPSRLPGVQPAENGADLVPAKE